MHEIGHALGLQHTLTSSVMSTDVTRAATRALPLGPDDIAGLSALYPTPDFLALQGGLSGRVTNVSGAPINLASVVAVGANGHVVSALTAPDGAYRMDGLLPGKYVTYVHPLPPATQEGLGPANIVLATAPGGETFQPSGPFKTIFYGGTTRPSESAPIEVTAGGVTGGVDFQVEPQSSLPLYSLTTYSFPGNGAAGVHPAFLDATDPAGFILATGPGLAENAGRLAVESLEGDLGVRRPEPYELDARFVRVDFDFSALTQIEPKHLIFRLPEDIYVLPRGVSLTSRPAPVVHWIAPGFGEDGGPIWIVRGTNFDARSAVYFDGWPGSVIDFDAEERQINVAPPVGPPGRRSVVTVYNPDGQSSAFTLPDGNVVFSFSTGPERSVSLSPPAAELDSDVVVEISGVNTEFLAGDTVVGFGTSDVVARETHVLEPGKIQAIVSVRGNAQPGLYKASVTTGLEILEAASGFRVTDPSALSDKPRLRHLSLVNSATLQPRLSPGVLASLFGSRLAVEGTSGVRVTLNGQPAPLLSVSPTQINLQIPPGLTAGTVVVEVFNGISAGDPMLVRLEGVAPGLFAILHADGRLVSEASPAAAGETVAVLATGLQADHVASPSKDGASGRRAASRPATAAVEAVSSFPGLYAIRFQVPAADASPSSVSVWVDGARSNALPLPLASPAE